LVEDEPDPRTFEPPTDEPADEPFDAAAASYDTDEQYPPLEEEVQTFDDGSVDGPARGDSLPTTGDVETTYEEAAAAPPFEDLATADTTPVAGGPMLPPPMAPPPVAEVVLPPSPAGAAASLTDEDVERIARRVLELAGDRLEQIAWEVIPDMAEIVVRERVRELEAEIGASPTERVQ
jgi:hypothetical protein